MPLNSTLESGPPLPYKGTVTLHGHGDTVWGMYWSAAVIDYLA